VQEIKELARSRDSKLELRDVDLAEKTKAGHRWNRPPVVRSEQGGLNSAVRNTSRGQGGGQRLQLSGKVSPQERDEARRGRRHQSAERRRRQTVDDHPAAQRGGGGGRGGGRRRRRVKALRAGENKERLMESPSEEASLRDPI